MPTHQPPADPLFPFEPAPAPPDGPQPLGQTSFDQPGSTDNAVTILLAQDRIQDAPAQSLLRIESRRDGRTYLAAVTAGPFAEPDGFKADSPVLIAASVHGATFLPSYHGRIEAEVLGEVQPDGSLTPPRWRPLPNSPVFAVSEVEAAERLKAAGDVRLGLAVGYENLPVAVPSTAKSVLPRHTAILGTTGGGKSTTVATLIAQARAAGMAVIVLDVEGEYTRLHEPTTNPAMLAALAERGQVAAGVPADRTTLYHLIGRDTANPAHPHRQEFSLQFARVSPYAAAEIMNLSEAQSERFFKAYDIAKELLRDLDIFPRKDRPAEERVAIEVDEFERGYPRVTLPLLIDIVTAAAELAGEKSEPAGKKRKDDEDDEPPPSHFEPRYAKLATGQGRATLMKRLHAARLPKSMPSWRALQGRLGRLNRLKVFTDDGEPAKPVSYAKLLEPGRLSVFDLSDSGFGELSNLVIADLLLGIQDEQDKAYEAFEKRGAGQPPRVLIVIEEAHEFLSEERIGKTPILFEQVARLARRGRKRWLGLTFVTQLPQHLPRQLLGLVNSFVLHKIADPLVAAGLRKSIPGIDEGLWNRLSGLAPGQAIVSFPHLTRPLLVSIDPAAAELRMTE